jgi:endo-1,4-beta-xylanase
MLRRLLALSLPALAGACIVMEPGQGTSTSPSGNAGPTLRSAAERTHRYIGAALSPDYFNEASYLAIAGEQFNSLTPENQMKWESIEPSPNKFTFDQGDSLVLFAKQNHMRVRGHTLVWHSQLASWVKSLSGDALHAAMLNHIKNVAGHYKGRIAEWDVVNEVMADGESGDLRPDSPFASLGPTFIDDAFRAAHDADPNAVLFYNDYEIEGPNAKKTEGAYKLVKRLKDAGVPIGGVGFQMHVDPRHWPTAEEIRQNFERFAALGVIIEITEMDVPVGAMSGSMEEKLAKQKAITKDIVAVCTSIPQCTGITIWGFTDAHSWLNDEQWGLKLRGPMPHYPLPFDQDYRPKPMFYGILDGFSGSAAAPASSH